MSLHTTSGWLCVFHFVSHLTLEGKEMNKKERKNRKNAFFSSPCSFSQTSVRSRTRTSTSPWARLLVLFFRGRWCHRAVHHLNVTHTRWKSHYRHNRSVHSSWYRSPYQRDASVNRPAGFLITLWSNGVDWWCHTGFFILLYLLKCSRFIAQDGSTALTRYNERIFSHSLYFLPFRWLEDV